MADMPKAVSIHEEGPREGFQFEKQPIPTARKVELIEALAETGVKEVQMASFVNPRRVPGWADADEVVERVRKKPGVHYTVLWLNEQGFLRAAEKDGVFLKGSLQTCASETFLKLNQNQDFSKNLEVQRAAMRLYRQKGVTFVRGSIMAVFGCNFEGDISTAKVIDAIQRMQDIADEHGVAFDELTLADTMAWATPASIKRVVGAVRERWPEAPITLHLHDTRGMGIANAYAGLEMGVSSFDSCVAGLGGCPFAGHKGAAGNVCTEDLVMLCEEMGISTGIDIERLIEVAILAEDIVGHPLPGSVKSGGSLRKLRAKVAAAAAAPA